MAHTEIMGYIQLHKDCIQSQFTYTLHRSYICHIQITYRLHIDYIHLAYSLHTDYIFYQSYICYM
jgi:hypothetical protein